MSVNLNGRRSERTDGNHTTYKWGAWEWTTCRCSVGGSSPIMTSLFSVTNITGTARRRWLGACSQLLNSFSFMFSATDTRVLLLFVLFVCLFIVVVLLTDLVLPWQMLFYADKSRCYNNNNYVINQLITIGPVDYYWIPFLIRTVHFSILYFTFTFARVSKPICPVFQNQKTYPPHHNQWPTPCRETCLTMLQSTLLTSCSCVFCTRCTFNQSQAPRWGVRCLRWAETREVSHTKFTHNTCLGFRPVDSRHTAHSLCTEYQSHTSFCPSGSLRSVYFV